MLEAASQGPPILPRSFNQSVHVKSQMFIQQPKKYQTLQTANWISATCVTTVKCMDVVVSLYHQKSHKRTNDNANERKTGKRKFSDSVSDDNTNEKSNTRGSVDLALIMKKLLGRETHLVFNVIQVLKLYNRAMVLRNTLYFGVQ
jgi:hypothetical protein